MTAPVSEAPLGPDLAGLFVLAGDLPVVSYVGTFPSWPRPAQGLK
jgi:hypothetical protein